MPGNLAHFNLHGAFALGGDRFNIECTVRGLDTPPDEYYLRWPVVARPEEIVAGRWLESMTPREELAGFLIQRAGCLTHNKRYKEAAEACLGACVAVPENTLHKQSTGSVIWEWRSWVGRLVPPVFPTVVIETSPGRRFPALIPDEVEHAVVFLEVMQDLVEDTEKEVSWWRFLRARPKTWPDHVPTQIEVSIFQEQLFPAAGD